MHHLLGRLEGVERGGGTGLLNSTLLIYGPPWCRHPSEEGLWQRLG